MDRGSTRLVRTQFSTEEFWINLRFCNSYLLSPQTSPIGGVGQATARIVLLGSRNPASWPTFYKDPDPIIFSEILEFALSLTTPAKGQESFNGLPHLQTYRLIRAMSLAEIGQTQQANRYVCPNMAALTLRNPQVLRSHYCFSWSQFAIFYNYFSGAVEVAV